MGRKLIFRKCYRDNVLAWVLCKTEPEAKLMCQYLGVFSQGGPCLEQSMGVCVWSGLARYFSDGSCLSCFSLVKVCSRWDTTCPASFRAGEIQPSESGRDGTSRPSMGGCSGGANDWAPDSALSYQLRVVSWRVDWGAGGKKTWVSVIKYISFPTPKQSHPLRSNCCKQLSL